MRDIKIPRVETPYGKTIIKGPLQRLSTPRATVGRLIASCWYRLVGPFVLRRLDQQLGDSRLDQILAGLRVDRAEAAHWPIASQLREIHKYRGRRVAALEEKQTWWMEKT